MNNFEDFGKIEIGADVRLYEPLPGEKISTAAKRMIALAKEIKQGVAARFNGIIVMANETSVEENIIADYMAKSGKIAEEYESPEENGAAHEGVEVKERIFTGEEVMAEIKKLAEKAEFVRELKDENGDTYLFEAQEPGKESGEFTLYAYQREGTFGKNSAAATVLEKVYFENDIPVGGDIVAEYDKVKDAWVEK